MAEGGSSPCTGGTTVKIAIAMYNFKTREEDELAFEKGEIIRVLNKVNDGWWYASSLRTEAAGLIPSNYVKTLDDEENEQMAPVGEDEGSEGQCAKSPASDQTISDSTSDTKPLEERSEGHCATPLASNQDTSDSISDTKPLEEERWFFTGIDWREAEEMILEPEYNVGTFLIRESISRPGSYTLSVRHWDPTLGNRVLHYKIETSPSGYYCNSRVKFISLQEMVKYYRENTDGLCQRLSSSSIRRQRRCRSQSGGSEIAREALRLGPGSVGEAWMDINKVQRKVFVRVRDLQTSSQDDFRREAEVRRGLQHERLVSFLGMVITSEPMLIISEFMVKGNLNNYLRNDLGKQLEPVVLIDFATQIAQGMVYMEENSYIHRDLRSANVFLSETLECKIGGLSLARKLESNKYILENDAKIAVKWAAPEVFLKGYHTTQSDIWAFGVLLMELVMGGHSPYPGGKTFPGV
uniref:Tyrosine-protein kinase n=1 Tax=Callorhinchus milii TaxID=7868 RepID=A0A4W3HP09_CALMI